MRHVRVLGVTIADQAFDDALAQLDRMVEADAPHSLFFVNAHTLNLAAADPEYRAVLNGADAVFGDGTGVRWGARARGVRLLDNLNGTDLIPAFMRRRKGLRCFLVGSTPERIARAGEAFDARFPDCVLVGAVHGYLDDRASAAVVEQINASDVDLLLVGMGNPLQEQWIARWRPSLRARLTAGVGGLLEYWVGGLDRAPAWMRRAGIEWLHILRRNPWKARRYLIGNPLFLGRVLLWLRADLNHARKAAAHG